MLFILEKLGQNPQASMKIFVRGLGLFALGLCLIAMGYFFHYTWQMAGIIVLAIACAVALWGYIGIFANRWYHILTRHNPDRHNK